MVINFFNSNFFVAFTTLLVGSFAIYLYIKQKNDKKRDAASLILQEVRYAEQKIRNYQSVNSYNLHEKILPTSSWNDNIHLFVNDLEEAQLDMISAFYSKATYIDILIEKISEQKNTLTPVNVVSTPNPSSTMPINQAQVQQIMQSAVNPVTQALLDTVSRGIEFIYNTPIAEKLKAISRTKRFSIL